MFVWTRCRLPAILDWRYPHLQVIVRCRDDLHDVVLCCVGIQHDDDVLESSTTYESCVCVCCYGCVFLFHCHAFIPFSHHTHLHIQSHTRYGKQYRNFWDSQHTAEELSHYITKSVKYVCCRMLAQVAGRYATTLDRSRLSNCEQESGARLSLPRIARLPRLSDSVLLSSLCSPTRLWLFQAVCCDSSQKAHILLRHFS